MIFFFKEYLLTLLSLLGLWQQELCRGLQGVPWDKD